MCRPFRLILLVFGFLSFIVPAHAAGPAPIDVVFDLDWTLISLIRPGHPPGDPKHLITAGEETYRVADGVTEVLNLLRRHPSVRISFFSGGSQERNEKVLRSIVLDRESGLTAYDLAWKRLHFGDLENLYPGETTGDRAQFKNRYRKNLARHFENLDRVILIDDSREFVAAGQAMNHLWTVKSFEFYPTFADASVARVDPQRARYAPTTRREWELERARIPIAFEALEAAIEEEEKASGSLDTFVQRVSRTRKISPTRWLEKWKNRFPGSSVLCRPLFDSVTASKI